MGGFPQGSYSVVVVEIQSEWIFLQSMTKDTGHLFLGVKKIMWGKKLPPSHCKRSKYASGKEIRVGHTEPCDISRRELYKLATCNLQAEW